MPPQKYGPRSKQERKARSKGTRKPAAQGDVDANAAEIIPDVAAQARAQAQARRQELREELVTGQNAMSSKKKKRLDKYIENKLRKEESAELMKLIAAQQAKSKITGLQSSKNLAAKKRSRSKYIAPPIKASNADYESDSVSDSEEGDPSDITGTEPKTRKLAMEEPRDGDVVKPNDLPPAPAFGSGLKRALEHDALGAPVIRKRQRVSMPVRNGRKATRDESDAVKLYTQKMLSLGSESDSKSETGSENSSENTWSGFGDDDDSDSRDSGESSDDSDDSEDGSDETGEDDTDEEAEDLSASMFAALAQAKKQNESSVESKGQKRDVSGFKEWAAQQLNEAKDFVPTQNLDDVSSRAKEDLKQIDFTPRPPEQDELPPELKVPEVSSDRKAHAVAVDRSQEIQAARNQLPVVAEEQKIMEAIHNNPVTVICGETGSGKTTQIPQFLFEAGYGNPDGDTKGMIAVTQPRRVAAVTMAQRVAKELGNFGNKVAYQIRYGSTVSKDTAIKFMTDGILVREIASDFRLSKYSAIVIDEAHERSVNTDILVGMLSRIVDLRSDEHREALAKRDGAKSDATAIGPLKLIIMSATLMAQAFIDNSRLFRRGSPPLVYSEGRQHKVVEHFSRRTERDYLNETFKKVVRGHKKLPHGAMLVFLTGENEILTLAKKLREALGLSQRVAPTDVRIAASEAPLETDDYQAGDARQDDFSEEEGRSDADSEDNDEDEEFNVEADESESRVTDALILPLYSKLPTKEQLKVFEPPPENTRLIVLATNVAETSITIPGVRYVFDCGRSKEKVYDQSTGVQTFEVGWISQASATQRKGRAGRTGPGHCYRLYSSAVYENAFAEHTKPEILRMPIEGVVLLLKSMDLQHVVNFPFPTSPDQQQIVQAEKLLSYLGAINTSGMATDLGRDLAIYPVSPRYAKMLAVVNRKDIMPLAIGLVAAITTSELFISESQLGIDSGEALQTRKNHDDRITPAVASSQEEARDQQRKDLMRAQTLFGKMDESSDAIRLFVAFGWYASKAHETDIEASCKQMFVRSKPAKEAHQLYQQLARIVGDNRPDIIDGSYKVKPPIPTPQQIPVMKQIVVVGFIDQVAIRADLLPSPPSVPKAKRATDVAYATLFPSHDERTTTSDERCVYVSPSSILARRKATGMPPFIVYSALQRGLAKVRMTPLTSTTASALAAMARGTPLLEYGKPERPIEAVQPNKQTCWVTQSLVGKRGTMGWPLGKVKVLQRKVRGVWEVESVVG